MKVRCEGLVVAAAISTAAPTLQNWRRREFSSLHEAGGLLLMVDDDEAADVDDH